MCLIWASTWFHVGVLHKLVNKFPRQITPLCTHTLHTGLFQQYPPSTLISAPQSLSFQFLIKFWTNSSSIRAAYPTHIFFVLISVIMFGEKWNLKCPCYDVVFITDSLEQNPSWEANRSSACQGTPRIYGTWKFITTFTRAHHNPACASPLPHTHCMPCLS